MSIGKRAAAEFFCTFCLVFGGCGAAVLSAAFPGLGIGFVGVALAFGLTVLTMAFAIGHISGCHLNPAISVGLLVGKRFPGEDLVPYIIAQVAGGICASAVLYVIASGKEGFSLSAGFASNGYGTHSPGGYSLAACFVAEVVLTLFFLFVIMGSTDKRAPQGFAPIAIGLCLTLIHLIGIPVTNLSSIPPAVRGRPFSSADGLSRSFGCFGWRRSSVARSGAASTTCCSANRTQPADPQVTSRPRRAQARS